MWQDVRSEPILTKSDFSELNGDVSRLITSIWDDALSIEPTLSERTLVSSGLFSTCSCNSCQKRQKWPFSIRYHRVGEHLFQVGRIAAGLCSGAGRIATAFQSVFLRFYQRFVRNRAVFSRSIQLCFRSWTYINRQTERQMWQFLTVTNTSKTLPELLKTSESWGISIILVFSKMFGKSCGLFTDCGCVSIITWFWLIYKYIIVPLTQTIENIEHSWKY